MAAAACSTPSGAGLGAMSPSSRVTTTSKSSIASAWKWRSARSTALRPLRVSTATARPASLSRRTSSSAPSLGAEASAASSSKRSSVAAAASRAAPSGSAEDPLEHELVRRAAYFALDGGEVERAGVRQRAVEVEDDGPQPERPRAAAAGAAGRRAGAVAGLGGRLVHRAGTLASG